MPGEYLWRRVIERDEKETQWLMGFVFVPVLVGWVAIHLLNWLLKSSPLTVVTLVLTVFVAAMLVCIHFFHRRLRQRANDYLGFFGERYVAERLDTLKARGWFVFHDIPCLGATGKFNLDHVAVGPGGIWVIETKTRRKGRVLPGLKDNEITFNGTRLECPWGDESDYLRQAADNADWLKKWLKEMTGRDFSVWAVLTFPGFFITEKKLGPVRVVYAKGLDGVVVSHGNKVLNNNEVDLVRRQLEAKCRDVQY